MTGVLKDYPFARVYLDDIIIFSRIAEEHLDHIRQVFEQLQNAHLLMKLSKCHFFAKQISTLDTYSAPQVSDHYHQSLKPSKTCTHFKQLSWYVQFLDLLAITENSSRLCKDGQATNLINHHKAKFEWTPAHHTSFMMLKEAIIQAPILHYPDPARRYIVYMAASDDTCGAQLTQEHNEAKFPIAFLSHTFTEMQRKWSTPEQEAYGVYYAITK